MKPLELVEKAITISSKRGESILDLFGGSWSTLIAAHQVDRKAYLMELDEKLVDVIVKRYLNFVDDIDDCYWIRDSKKINLHEIEDYNFE